jgi:hypothetical protein
MSVLHFLLTTHVLASNNDGGSSTSRRSDNKGSSNGTRGGNTQQHQKAGKAGGTATAQKYGNKKGEKDKSDFYQEIGSMGGRAAQQTGRAHRLTPAERSLGGQNSAKSRGSNLNSNLSTSLDDNNNEEE